MHTLLLTGNTETVVNEERIFPINKVHRSQQVQTISNTPSENEVFTESATRLMKDLHRSEQVEFLLNTSPKSAVGLIQDAPNEPCFDTSHGKIWTEDDTQENQIPHLLNDKTLKHLGPVRYEYGTFTPTETSVQTKGNFGCSQNKNGFSKDHTITPKTVKHDTENVPTSKQVHPTLGHLAGREKDMNRTPNCDTENVPSVKPVQHADSGHFAGRDKDRNRNTELRSMLNQNGTEMQSLRPIRHSQRNIKSDESNLEQQKFETVVGNLTPEEGQKSERLVGSFMPEEGDVTQKGT